MNYLEFRNKMFDLACFNINQVYALDPDFSRNNLVRWTKQGLLIRLRQGYYTFPEYKGRADYPFYFANRMYRPSYISLHSALSFYGMIPESVVQITSVTSLKTSFFSNEFGEYSYKTVKEDLMFGYEPKPMADNRTFLFARPEKALLDLLYLYPFYSSAGEIENLRLDESYIEEDLNRELLLEFTSIYKNKTLEKRVRQLMTTYGL
jgi:predicted transcriptional regulator of viral defense system